jgi:hypothetical protein
MRSLEAIDQLLLEEPNEDGLALPETRLLKDLNQAFLSFV